MKTRWLAVACLALCACGVPPEVFDAGSGGAGGDAGKDAGRHDAGAGGGAEPDAGLVGGEDSGSTPVVDAGTDAGSDAGTSESSYGAGACGDGIDNDHDGLIDCLDPDCASQLCRAASGDCDVAESCSNNQCPPDAFKPASNVCRTSAGDCDVSETCTGASAACPADLMRSGGVACRPSQGACDSAETCTGNTATCPPDAFLPATSVCRAASSSCDVEEKCSGSTAACPFDALAAAGTVCRTSSGSCDFEETCSGATATCPADSLVSAGTVCRSVAGPCDVQEVCTGAAAACPADQFASQSVTCRPQADVCDVSEVCSGNATACPPDILQSAGVQCRSAAGVCDKPEVCTGSSASCPSDAFEPSTLLCRAAACSANQSTPDTYCAGSTQCPVPAPSSCGAYVCQNPTHCYQQCVNDFACAAGFFCSANPFGGGGSDCLPKQADGTSCFKGSQCWSGACTQFWRDADFDTFTTTSSSFCGSTPPAGYRAAQKGLDCDDNASNTFPGQTQFFKSPRATGGYDYNCDGAEDRELVSLGGCSSVTCSFPGSRWVAAAVPYCGGSGQLLTSCSFGGFSCNFTSQPATQGCH